MTWDPPSYPPRFPFWTWWPPPSPLGTWNPFLPQDSALVLLLSRPSRGVRDRGLHLTKHQEWLRTLWRSTPLLTGDSCQVVS